MATRPRSIISSLAVIALTLAFTVSNVNRARGDTIIFADNFNRPDGAVANGWSNWGNPNSSLVGGQLQTFGLSGAAGGIARALTVGSPFSFSFDFRTLNVKDDFDPSLPYNDGGWYIAFNSLSPTFFGPGQLAFYQYAGSRTINRLAGATSDASPGLPGRIPGWEDFNSSFSHVSGTVNSDLSALITLTYSDGTSVSGFFGAASGGAPGGFFLLGNSNRSSGPDYFDNLVITELSGTTSPVPEPGSFVMVTTAVAILFGAYKTRRSCSV